MTLGLSQLRLMGNAGGAGGAPLFEAPLLTDVLPVRALNYAVTTPAAGSVRMVEDHEGILRRVAAGELRFRGARRGETLLADGNLQDWTKSAIGGGVVENLAGDAETVRMFMADGVSGRVDCRYAAAGVTLYTGEIYCFSIEWKQGPNHEASVIAARDEFQTMWHTGGDIGYCGVLNTEWDSYLTDEWQRIYWLMRWEGADGTTMNIFRVGAGVNADWTPTAGDMEIYYRRPQLEVVGGASIQMPSTLLDPDTYNGS
jgi:hypothetical protein